MPEKKLSKYVTEAEGWKSDTAARLKISNVPDAATIEKMKYVATEIFDKVREFAGGPLHVNSFYRSPELNAAIKGSKSSQHMKGEAIDMDCDQFGNSTNEAIFHYIKDNLDFDQLIWEYPDKEGTPSWIHCSKVSYKKNRKQVLVALSTGYVKFADWKPGTV